jgi:DNA polymerase V
MGQNKLSDNQQRIYEAIDLKSFYASVECVARGKDPLTTNLVVADESRTEKTICLAVSPSLKAYHIAGRARLFEVVQRIKEINYERLRRIPDHRFKGKSASATELNEHPDWEVDYIVATPRMAEYIRVSTDIYGIYLKYIAPEDIHVYSIDEVFMDVTDYLVSYRKTPHELAIEIIHDILSQTGITATAGIGTNLYLAKVAMDIVAKHTEADQDGVRIAELDEMNYRQLLWNHQPLTDFWRVGHGIARKLAMYGIKTMGQIARMSINNEELLYRLFGVNAELLIDHAWGWEPCTMPYIKAHKPEMNSMGSGQVLPHAYDFKKARVVMLEMADALAMDLVDKRLVTDQLAITINYDGESLRKSEYQDYTGPIAYDYYGRVVPRHVQGAVKLERLTSSSRLIRQAIDELFCRIVDHSLLVRRLNITAVRVINEDEALREKCAPIQLDLFTDYEAEYKAIEKEETLLANERNLQKTVLAIKKKFGKNAILKGLDFAEGATARERNNQIGGHKA